jgi:hypothetical protein
MGICCNIRDNILNKNKENMGNIENIENIGNI